MVEVFTQPNCAPCVGTKAFLDEHKIEFVERNIQSDPTALDELVALGFKSTPVVKTADDVWAGLNLSKLRSLAA